MQFLTIISSTLTNNETLTVIDIKVGESLITCCKAMAASMTNTIHDPIHGL